LNNNSYTGGVEWLRARLLYCTWLSIDRFLHTYISTRPAAYRSRRRRRWCSIY